MIVVSYKFTRNRFFASSA